MSAVTACPAPGDGPGDGLPRRTILTGDAVANLGTLPTGSVDCVVTSPPYLRLRDYGVSGQLGLETDVGSWVRQLLDVTADVKRVLVPTGTFWLNLGDSYSTHEKEGAPAKSLVAAPERMLLGLLNQGWTLRNKIVWAKTNPMPTSVSDRLACTHETIYLLAASPRYFFDLDAIRVPLRTLVSTRPRGVNVG